MEKHSRILPKIFSMAVMLAIALNAFAQVGGGRILSGTVVDADGLGLPGAAVIVVETNQGTVADDLGQFTIEVKEGQSLNFLMLGFKDKTIKIGKEDNLTITLEEDANLLADVVVVGYGTEKKANLTGSVNSISTAEFSQRPITQLSTALQGLAPGVTVTTAGGAPGSDSGNIQIRGIGSFGGSNSAPLVLIDGVEGDFNSVDASQIDQISVLKDAASSAIYGSRAANGVIIITTKRASEGTLAITYRGYVGWQTPTRYPDVVGPEDYMRLYRQAYENDGKTTKYTDEYIENYRKNNYLDPDAYPIIDWQDRLLTGNGFTHNHILNMSFGTEKIKVMTSIGYLDQNAIIKSSGYQRYNLRNNLDIKLLDNLNFRLDISGTFARKETNPYQGNIFHFMNGKDPLMLAQWSDGNYAPFTGGTLNVLPMIEQGLGGNNVRNDVNFKLAASLEYKPWEWLTIDLKAAPQVKAARSHKFIDLVKYYSDAYGTPSTASNAEYNSLTESVSTTVNGYYHATINAAKQFGDHNLKVLLGYSYENYDYYSLGAYRQDFLFPQYEVMDAGGDNEFKDNSGYREQMALSSFFGRVNYNYKERYLFEANLRYDGSSRFAKGHRWGLFPSFSAAWRITEEPFMMNTKNTLSNLKFRASYGSLGNQNIGGYYPTYQLLTLSSISAGNNLYPITALNDLANREITWETTTMFDVGIDATLWHKFTITADWYHKITNDILMKLDIPSSVGIDAPYQNAGIVTNQGWELALGYNDQWGDFNFGVQANLSDVINNIVEMKGTTGGSGVIRNQEGTSINSLYMLKALGIVQTQEEANWINMNCPQYSQTTRPGDLVYEDYNKDGKIDDDDKQILGSLIPRYTYGLTLNFGWKGINLSTQFQGVGKADAYISGEYTQPCVQGGTFQKSHLDNWAPENRDAKYPRLSYTSDLNRKVSDFWMADASYLRLKNVQLSYTFPEKALKKLHLKGLMVYANATNLLTFDNYYEGYDPETAYQGGSQGATTGSIGGNYPLVSTYTFGLEIKF